MGHKTASGRGLFVRTELAELVRSSNRAGAVPPSRVCALRLRAHFYPNFGRIDNQYLAAPKKWNEDGQKLPSCPLTGQPVRHLARPGEGGPSRTGSGGCYTNPWLACLAASDASRCRASWMSLATGSPSSPRAAEISAR